MALFGCTICMEKGIYIYIYIYIKRGRKSNPFRASHNTGNIIFFFNSSFNIKQVIKNLKQLKHIIGTLHGDNHLFHITSETETGKMNFRDNNYVSTKKLPYIRGDFGGRVGGMHIKS